MTKRKASFRTVVLERDDYACQCCGVKSVRIEVHHIEPLTFGGADEINNLISLCFVCHKEAPNDPDLFLEYQKQGGKRTIRVIATLMPVALRQGMTIVDILPRLKFVGFQELPLGFTGSTSARGVQLSLRQYLKPNIRTKSTKCRAIV